ncbi:unnamed protein product [marine sediment metagenome]|uniref:Uncharacterized protein n=1 Tax=marine sediment metagenome TaxID=412755 RepID=X0YU84_9ZZZZ
MVGKPLILTEAGLVDKRKAGGPGEVYRKLTPPFAQASRLQNAPGTHGSLVPSQFSFWRALRKG